MSVPILDMSVLILDTVLILDMAVLILDNDAFRHSILVSVNPILLYFIIILNISLFWCFLRLIGARHLLHLLEEVCVHSKTAPFELEAQLLACIFGDNAMFRDCPGKDGDFFPKAVLIYDTLISSFSLAEITWNLADFVGLGALIFFDGSLLRRSWLLSHSSTPSQFQTGTGFLFWRFIFALDGLSRFPFLFHFIILVL